MRVASRSPLSVYDPGMRPDLAGYGHIDTVFEWRDEGELSYETARENGIAAAAERAGRHPGEVLIDRMLARRLEGFFYIPIFNQSLDAVASMLTHPAAVIGLGDAGAHAGQICDASVPTFTLAYWVRRRRVLGLEHVPVGVDEERHRPDR